MTDADLEIDITFRAQKVRNAIADAAVRVGRDPAQIMLLSLIHI